MGRRGLPLRGEVSRIAASTLRASAAGLPVPQKCTNHIIGEMSQRCWCSAYTFSPLASIASMTGWISLGLSARSPFTIARPGLRDCE